MPFGFATLKSSIFFPRQFPWEFPDGSPAGSIPDPLGKLPDAVPHTPARISQVCSSLPALASRVNGCPEIGLRKSQFFRGNPPGLSGPFCPSRSPDTCSRSRRKTAGGSTGRKPSKRVENFPQKTPPRLHLSPKARATPPSSGIAGEISYHLFSTCHRSPRKSRSC